MGVYQGKGKEAGMDPSLTPSLADTIQSLWESHHTLTSKMQMIPETNEKL
jgi:hypothetical protein